MLQQPAVNHPGSRRMQVGRQRILKQPLYGLMWHSSPAAVCCSGLFQYDAQIPENTLRRWQ